MSNYDAMKLKNSKEIINSIYKKYSRREDNVFYLERLFVAATVIRWAFEQTTNTQEILQYLMQVERHLEGEIELYWQDGVIKTKNQKRGNK